MTADTWYLNEKTEDAQIMSARVRLARNLKKYPFKRMLKAEDARQMISDTTSAVKNDRTAIGVRYNVVDIQQHSDTDKRVFLEKHLVSPEFIKTGKPTGMLLQDDENVCIMVNEEDHIRIQTFAAGDGIHSAFELAGHIDDLIEESLEYAFDKDYGYLTSCPTNTGTGLRASFMMHLPILEKTKQLKKLLPAISKFGIAIRGIYGEGTESMGCIYQISNQITLGKSEQDIIQGLKNVAQHIIDKENWLLEKMLEQHRLDMENNASRAYGLLAYSKQISIREAMDLLSELRLGYMAGLLEMPRPEKSLYQIMMEIQPGHLQKMSGQEMNEQEQDVLRATCLRTIFK